MIDYLEWILDMDEDGETGREEVLPDRGRVSVRAPGPDGSPGGGAEGAGETLLYRGPPSVWGPGPDSSPGRGAERLGEDPVPVVGETLPGRNRPPVWASNRASGLDGSPGGEGGRLRKDLVPAGGEALLGWGRPSVRASGPDSTPTKDAWELGKNFEPADRAGGGGPAELESLPVRARRLRAAAAYAAGRREPVAVPVPVAAEGGGRALEAGELDRIFQRDARRYDGGFTLY